MEEDQKELQLLPTPQSTPSSSRMPSWPSEPSSKFRSNVSDPFEGPSLDLQLSISLRPIRPPSDCVLMRPICDYPDGKPESAGCIEALKWQTAEQIRLAAIEKAYAERVKELTRREMELAQSEFARARQLWERAREEVEKAERMKESATRQVDSTGNAINRLASVNHLKKLKGFMWKYRIDSFSIDEADLAKWEKKCKSLKSEAASEGSSGLLIGPSNDIHNELNCEYIDTFGKKSIPSLKSSFLDGVIPLQYCTNERSQLSHSELSETGPFLHDANLYFAAGTQMDTNPWGLKDLSGHMDSQLSLPHDNRKSSSKGYNNGGVSLLIHIIPK
ncbi:hypothetical protein F0562_023266 [Nyssa sinensis]|uniref:Uncharacterized protein n=1 Tax=Nyssa sinensis TaxID=561372 RepID=A0A5J5BG94_9ASTE|nr:hypothetical protein F0562_023266 [Nyssa sinensis]